LALKIVRWHMILEIDAQRRLLAKDHKALPRILVSSLFAGQWIGAVVCLPRVLEVGAEGFAGQEPSKSSLHVVCLSRIQEVGAEGRLLAKDPKFWRCKPLAGCGCWKLALNLGASDRLLEVWRCRGILLQVSADGRLLAEDLEVGAVLQ